MKTKRKNKTIAPGRLGRIFSPSRKGTQQVLTITVAEGERFCFRLFSLSQGQVSLVHDYGSGTGDEDVFAALRAAGHRLRPDLDIVFLIPRRHVLIKHLKLPTQDQDQIAQMVPYEANSQSPWSREESLFSYESIENPTSGHSTLVLYLVRLEWVERCLEGLRKRNVFPTQVEVSTRGLECLMRSSEPTASSSMLVVCEGETEYVRLSPTDRAFSRAASIEDETPKETLQRSLDIDRRAGLSRERSSTLIVVGCPLNTFDGLPADILPKSVIALEDVEFPVLNGLAPLSPSLTMGVGATLLAISPTATANLLPPSYLRWLEPRRLLRRARSMGLLLLWFVGVLGALGYYHYQDQVTRAQVAQSRIEALGADVGDLEAKSDALLLLRSERQRVSVPLRIVLELYEKTPQRIAINSMRLEERGNLILGCEAPDFQAVFAYLEALKSSKLLEQVNLVTSSRPQRAVDGLVEFKVKCQLSSAMASGAEGGHR